MMDFPFEECFVYIHQMWLKDTNVCTKFCHALTMIIPFIEWIITPSAFYDEILAHDPCCRTTNPPSVWGYGSHVEASPPDLRIEDDQPGMR
jgi:hypothetical protein